MSGPGPGRRISSLSVTYQEEYHSHRPAEAKPPVSNGCSIYTLHPQDVAFPEDQTITCNDFQGLSDTQELNNPPNFYSSSSPLSQLENPLTTEQEQQQQQQQPLCPGVPCGGQLPLPAACSVVPFIPWPAGNPLYGLEDTLRHKINVQIEDFRAAVQHTLGEQFNQYRFPAQNNTQSNTLPETNTHQDSHVVPSQEASQERFEDRTCSNVDEKVIQSEIDSCPGSYQNFVACSQEDSCDASTGTTDSGIISEPSKPSVDEQIDHYLIELQMYASVITQTLMRTEYSTT